MPDTSKPSFDPTPLDKRGMFGRLGAYTHFLARVWRNRKLIRELLRHGPFLAEVVRLSPFVKQVMQERHWLETALEEKDFITRALDRKSGEEALLKAFQGVFHEFQAASERAGARLSVREEDLYPQLQDATSGTNFDRHYLYHPAWAARVLAHTKPQEHVDISSILHFATLVSAFLPVRFFDYRPAQVELENFSSAAADLLALPFPDESIASLSCLHVLEHIGLGRYGDPLDPDGDLKAIRELVRVLKPGGTLLIATPVGKPRVQFNAHRIYDAQSFAGYFAPLELVEFSLIPEHGPEAMRLHASFEEARTQIYACGCFWFRKAGLDPALSTVYPAGREEG